MERKPVNRPKMAAVDVDGTLVDQEDRMLPGNEAAIRSAVQAGIHVVISTGRPYEGIKSIIHRFGLTDPAVTLGGAVVTSASGEVYRSYSIPPSQVRDIYAFCAKRGLSVRAQGKDGLYLFFRNPDHPDRPFMEDRFRRWDPYPFVVLESDAEMPLRGVNKVTILFEDESLMERFRPEIEATFTSLNFAQSYKTWLEFTARGTNKLRGVKYVARMLGVRRRDVMAIGDNENDLEMVKWAGMGMFVDSASANLRAFARLAPPPGVPAVAWGLTQLAAGAIPVPPAGRAAGARIERALSS